MVDPLANGNASSLLRKLVRHRMVIHHKRFFFFAALVFSPSSRLAKTCQFQGDEGYSVCHRMNRAPFFAENSCSIIKASCVPPYVCVIR